MRREREREKHARTWPLQVMSVLMVISWSGSGRQAATRSSKSAAGHRKGLAHVSSARLTHSAIHSTTVIVVMASASPEHKTNYEHH